MTNLELLQQLLPSFKIEIGDAETVGLKYLKIVGKDTNNVERMIYVETETNDIDVLIPSYFHFIMKAYLTYATEQRDKKTKSL